MKSLHKDLAKHCGADSILSISVYPTLGVNDYFHCKIDPNDEEEMENFKTLSKNPYSESDYLNDYVISRHPRFGALTKNIRQRKGSKVKGLVPIFKDKYTNVDKVTKDEPYPGFIHMDSMAFGMGCCCYQLTIGCSSFNAALFQYDQLIPLTPIINLLSGSSPIFKGKLSNWDLRYNLVGQLVDCRKPEELDPKSSYYNYKSRYSSVYSYISENVYIQDHHNDYPKFPINKDYLNDLIDHGFKPRIAEHICNLFVKDPILIYEKKILINDPHDMSHFINLQSTNWNSLRFKPPVPSDNDDCFKIEIRSADLQLTPYENAALSTFVIIYSQLIVNYDVNFIIPILLVDKNFDNSHVMNSILDSKFYWRTNSIPERYRESNLEKYKFLRNVNDLPEGYSDPIEDSKNIELLTLAEILEGKGNYPGLLKVMFEYIDSTYDESKGKVLKEHLYFLLKRAKGKLMTDARYIRQFVLNHEDYKQDSIISDKIAYDLVKHLLKVQKGEIVPSELFG